MKIGIAAGFIALFLFAVLTEPAWAQTNHVDTAPAMPPPTNNAAADLVTRTGAVYKNFHVEQTDASGITISYTPTDGGAGLTRIPFEELPDALQKQYGGTVKAAADADETNKPKPGVPVPAPPVLNGN